MSQRILRWIMACGVAAAFFGAQEAQALTAAALEEYFGIYTLTKEHRSNQDRVLLKGDDRMGYSAEINYWRSLQSRDPAEEICNAYKWLFFGRGKYSHGADDAFKQFPSLNQIYLLFFDVEGGTKLGKKKAEILPVSRVIPYLKISVDKRSLAAKRMDVALVKEQMEKGKCAEYGNRYLDSRWFDEGYLKQGK